METKNIIIGKAIEFTEKHSRNASGVEKFTLQEMLKDFAINECGVLDLLEALQEVLKDYKEIYNNGSVIAPFLTRSNIDKAETAIKKALQ